MARVFISHSFSNKDFAHKLLTDLKDIGHDPWLDEICIVVGESIPKKISEALDACDYILVILSNQSVQSNWVEQEWHAKYWKEVDSGKVIILPVLIEDCEIPTLLKSKKYADFRANYSVGLSELSKALGKGASQLETHSAEARIIENANGDILVYDHIIPISITSLLGYSKNRTTIDNKMWRVVDKLQKSCSISDAINDEIDKALSDRDIARFNHLQQDQAEEFARIGDNIIEYIRHYLDSRTSGDLARFKIRFTDSRALFGVEKLNEWIIQDLYLQRLDKLTNKAASYFRGEGLITRTFIIPSFLEVSLDINFKKTLFEILKRYLLAYIPVSLVSVRKLDDLGFDSVNFCMFEGGHLMKLDIGHSQTLKIYDERIAHRFNALHDDLQQNTCGIIKFSSPSNLISTFEERILEQARFEVSNTKSLTISQDAKVTSTQYTEEVARWWSDPGWDKERREIETNFLRSWFERYIRVSRPTVIDTACGTGTHAFILAGEGCSVTACDASWHQIERAKLIAKRFLQNENSEVGPQNPFFRTLSWLELPNHYSNLFHALLCLGGSLIHAPAADVSAVANAFCRTVRRGGHIILDHRNINFFRNPVNRSARHAGHSREVTVDFESNHIIFRMKDNKGTIHMIEGTLHPLPLIIKAFESAGATLINISHNHTLATVKNPEWYHLTFCVP